MKTKNDSMGILKLKLDITPENIECLKSLFLKPENKTSDIIQSDNSGVVEKSTKETPMVATLRTNCGLLQEGDTVVSNVSEKIVYIGVVTRFTENQVFLKNAYRFHVAHADNGNNWTFSPLGNVSISPESIVSITKNQ